jgi:hypothetical protein
MIVIQCHTEREAADGMRLDFLVLADRAEAINGKLYMVGGGFDRVGLMELPGSAVYDLALGFLVDYNETNEPHTFSLKLEDEDGNAVLGPIGGRVEVGRPAGMTAGQEQRVIIVLRGPFPVQRAGGFKWVPELDGVRHEATRFFVDQVQPPVLPVPG